MEEVTTKTWLSQSTKNIIAILLLGVGLFLLSYLFLPYVPGQRRLDSEFDGKVTIGMVRWPGYVPFFVAQEKNFFKLNGVDAEIIMYDNLSQLSQDYRDGRITARANTTYDAALETLAGVNQKVVLAIDRSYGADAIIASPEIKYVEELRGKKVAFEYGTLEEFFLRYVLDERGLSLNDIIPINLSPELAPQAVIDGQADAAVTYEPTLRMALQSGKVHVIFSTIQAPGIITDILTFKTDFIASYPKTVENILRAYFEGYEFWRENQMESYGLASVYLNDTPSNIAEQAQQVQFLGLVDNDVAFTSETGFHSLQENVYKALQFTARERGELFLKQRAVNLLDSSFVIKLYNELR